MPDIFEGADAAANSSTAYTLSVGQTAQGQLGSASDHDFYRVNLVAGQSYTIAMAGTGVNNVVDPFLRLYGSNGTTVIASDDDSLPGGNSIITFTVTATGTYYIDAGSFNNGGSGQYGVSITQGTKASLDIRMGAGVIDTDYAWTSTPGTGATVTYGYRQSPAGYTVNGSDISTFTQFTASEIAATEQILRMFSDVCNVTFSRVNPSGYTNSATILLANYNDPNDGAGAFAYYPGSAANGNAAGDVWLNTDSVNVNSLPVGSYSYFTLIHELGHALGLSHPGLYDAAPGVSITYANNAQFVQDSHQYTVMSYFDESATGANLGGYPDTLMMLDIYALQQIYGANWSTRAGNTVYGFGSNAGSTFDFSTNTSPGLCIWDGGGVDSLNCSGFSQNQIINLTDGTFSNIGGRTGNVSIAINAIIENAVGGSGADTMTGNAANNALSGGGGNDNLQGGAGNDTLDGGSGNDAMAGGAGDDTYIVDSTADTVTEIAGQGSDTVVTSINNYQAQANIENLTAALTAGQTLTGNSLNNVLTGNIGNDVLFAGDGVDIVVGGDGNDVLVAHSVGGLFLQEGDDLSGGNGNDSLYGDAFDTLNGGAGFDVLLVINAYDVNLDLAAASIEYVVSDWGDDLYTAASWLNAVEVYASGGNDTIIGGFGNDWLWGGVHDDVISGNDGNDVLVGGQGADSLSGGTGKDRIYIDTDDTLIDGGAGYDAAYIDGGTGFTLDMAATSFEWVTDFVNGDDAIDASGQTSGVEIYSGGGTDHLIGSDGNDRIFAGIGADVLIGGDSADVLVGESGADSLLGEAGNDRLYIDTDDILIDGGAGFDAAYIMGGNGFTLDMAATSLEWVTDSVNGNDTIDASGHTVGVEIYSAGGTDYLTGGAANDRIFGGTGNDRLVGNAGNDVLAGEAGVDRLIGGVGDDRLDGGTDADIFVWTTGGGIDTVLGWQDGFDKLEFNQVAGLDDAGGLAIVSNGDDAEVVFGADKLFIVSGAAGLINGADFLFT